MYSTQYIMQMWMKRQWQSQNSSSWNSTQSHTYFVSLPLMRFEYPILSSNARKRDSKQAPNILAQQFSIIAILVISHVQLLAHICASIWYTAHNTCMVYVCMSVRARLCLYGPLKQIFLVWLKNISAKAPLLSTCHHHHLCPNSLA